MDATSDGSIRDRRLVVYPPTLIVVVQRIPLFGLVNTESNLKPAIIFQFHDYLSITMVELRINELLQ